MAEERKRSKIFRIRGQDEQEEVRYQTALERQEVEDMESRV
jgi:hypothetical protein